MNKAISPPAACFEGRRARFIIISASILWLCSVCSGRYSGGSGEPNDPYRIAMAADLNDIGNHIEDFNKCFILLNDINLAGYTGTQFRIIGDETQQFTGLFDGNYYAITNLTWRSYTSRPCVGLFGSVGAGGRVKNLGMEDANIIARSVLGRVGALAGCNRGMITDCYSTGTIMGTIDVGGLAGYNDEGTIANCFSTAAITAGPTDISAGGLAGTNLKGTITDCYSSGTIIGGNCCGGLVGMNLSGNITRCHSTGNVRGNNYVGGLVGDNEPNSEPEDSPITQCYSKGQVQGNLYVGGLVGSNGYFGDNSTISNCYSTSSVSGDYIGGLVGYNWYGAVIDKCYSTGQVTGTNAGGMVGNSYCNLVTASFWDTQTSGMTISCGGMGIATIQMKTKSTFTGAGWDFADAASGTTEHIWDICQGTNYPRFGRQIRVGDFRCPDGAGFTDFALIGSAWRGTPANANWNAICDISEPNDGVIDELDLAVFCYNWLEGL